MSARLTAVENNQTEFRSQLSEVLMTSQNNESRLKSATATLDNLSTMVAAIFSRLESKTVVSTPNHSGGNHDQVARSPPKSPRENQSQSKPAAIGASSALPVDVVEVSFVPSEDEHPPRQSVRITRSKDVKFKGISGVVGNSEVGMKGSRGEKVLRRKKATRGGGSKGGGNEGGSEQALSAAGATQEGAVSEGGDVGVGGGPDQSTLGGSGGEVVSGNAGVQDVPEVGEVTRVLGVGDSGEAGSGGGVVSPQGGTGQTDRADSGVGDGGEVRIVAGEPLPAQSPGRGVSAFSVTLRSKTQSPNKLGGNHGQDSANDSEVSLSQWAPIPSTPKPANPAKLLIFNVHGTLLDTSLLTQPNPNPKIRVTKKTKTRRFVFRPWMMELLGRCFSTFRVAFWGLKSSEYMDEVLREILPVFEHTEGHKHLFSWSAKECEVTQQNEEGKLWGKPLTKVWKRWPCWNATNTIIVDHHVPRVQCNPRANVIAPPSFYIANMKSLEEDNEYLKRQLWPALEALCLHNDVANFWSTCNVSSMKGGVCQVNQFFQHMAPDHPCTPTADPSLQVCEGEGTCGLEGHSRPCPLTVNLLQN